MGTELGGCTVTSIGMKARCAGMRMVRSQSEKNIDACRACGFERHNCVEIE